MRQKAEFVKGAFLKCLDSSLDTPATEHFFGPYLMPTSTVAVPTVIEFESANFELIDRTEHEDVLNHEWKGAVLMWYSAARTRSQGLTKPETPLDIFKVKPNGVWGAWSDWQRSMHKTRENAAEVALLKRDKNGWSLEIGPGLQSYGALAKLSNDVAGPQGSPYYSAFDQVVKAKPSSCDTMFVNVAPKTPDVRNARTSVYQEMPARDGVTWINGDPTFKDGNTIVKLSHSLIVVEQGSTSARFYLPPKGSAAQGVGIILVPPPATSRETYNTQTHQYANSNPAGGDPTGNYPDGPPPGMKTKLGPFAQVAMKAIDQAKQTPDGTQWDDQYFRNILKPYNTPASNPR